MEKKKFNDGLIEDSELLKEAKLRDARKHKKPVAPQETEQAPEKETEEKQAE